MSISKKIRPVCDYSGLPCGSVWYIRNGGPRENMDENDKRDYNSSNVTILSKESFESGKIPKCFDPTSFERVTLSEKLEKANRNSR